MTMTEHDKTRAAADKVDAQIGFYIHFAVYVLVMLILLGVNYYNQAEGWWVQWPAMGWGIGILGHAFGAFGRSPQRFTEWRLRRIQRARESL